jgi:adenylosuccinate synthase
LQGKDIEDQYYRVADVICDLKHYCDFYKHHEMKNVEELDLYKEYKFAYDKATELEFFDKQQEADYYYEYAQQLKKKIDNGETILYKVNF